MEHRGKENQLHAAQGKQRLNAGPGGKVNTPQMIRMLVNRTGALAMKSAGWPSMSQPMPPKMASERFPTR
jgi:hypothetical protein